MSSESTSTTETEGSTSYPDQDWGKITFCVVLAIIAALVVHYVVFAVILTSVDLVPTVHAFIGMVLFFVAGFISFSIFY